MASLAFSKSNKAKLNKKQNQILATIRKTKSHLPLPSGWLSLFYVRA